jgi:hypothetical protein
MTVLELRDALNKLIDDNKGNLIIFNVFTDCEGDDELYKLNKVRVSIPYIEGCSDRTLIEKCSDGEADIYNGDKFSDEVGYVWADDYCNDICPKRKDCVYLKEGVCFDFDVEIKNS